MRGPLAAGLVAVALVGCGGRSEIEGTGGVIGAVAAGGGGAGEPDSGEDASDESSVDFAVCPDAPPTPGTVCDSPGYGCSYPYSTTRACVACNASRVWVSTPGQCP